MQFGLTENSYKKIQEVIKRYNNYTFKIFGSRARGDYKTGSDIDIAVEGIVSDSEKKDIRNSFDLLDIPYMIDIVFICEIEKEELLNSIKRDGVIYE